VKRKQYEMLELYVGIFFFQKPNVYIVNTLRNNRFLVGIKCWNNEIIMCTHWNNYQLTLNLLAYCILYKL